MHHAYGHDKFNTCSYCHAIQQYLKLLSCNSTIPQVIVMPFSLVWAIWKQINIIIFEDAPFFLSMLKLSFFKTLCSWVGSSCCVVQSFVTILLCNL